MRVRKHLMHIYHELVVRLKSLVYGARGEPYRIGGVTLRFVPGTRPIRLRHAHSDNPVNRYDAMQIEILSSQLNEGDVAIDIGAHHGAYSLIMAARCGPGGKVIAFEPDPYARKVLDANLALNPGLPRPVVENLACSDSAGQAVLYSRGGNSQSSLARSAIEFSATQTAEKLPVQLVTLDSYLRERQLPAPTWVKIDAEGAEIRILKGAEQLLAGDTHIVCELHPYAWQEFGNDFSELKELVAKSGRSMRYLDADTEIGENAVYGTVILERRR